MTISVGDSLPEATFLVMGDEGPASVSAAEIAGSGKAAIFGVPGAFTGTCSVAHLPSFMRTREEFAKKGVDTVACVAVNDPFVMAAWAADTGAGDAGIRMLADPEGAFVKALGLEFSAPPVGLIGRSKRFSMLVEDGKVAALNVEENPGVCEVSAGETLLSQVG